MDRGAAEKSQQASEAAKAEVELRESDPVPHGNVHPSSTSCPVRATGIRCVLSNPGADRDVPSAGSERPCFGPPRQLRA